MVGNLFDLKSLFCLVPIGLLAICSACVPKPENEVVVYAAVDREFAAPILDGFERQSDDMLVTRQYDVEATKTLGLVSRLENEAEKPLCDVFWNNEILHTIRLQQAGLLQQRVWQIPSNWPANFAASDGTWVGVAARARVLLVNTEILPALEDRPSSVTELADPRWKKKCAMAFPIYGTTATHMTVLATQSDPMATDTKSSPLNADKSGSPALEGFETWIRQVQQNAIIVSGNKQVAQAVSAGDVAWGLTDTDDAVIEIENGQSVAIVFPDQSMDLPGTLFIPNSIAVLKGSPHPVAAELLADYLSSRETEERLAMGFSAQFPIWPDATVPSRLQPESELRWMTADFEAAAIQWPEVSKLLRAVFEGQ